MPNKLGAMPPKIDIRDYKYMPAGASQQDYPEEYSCWVPEVKDQGQVNSCVAHVSAQLEECFNHKERGSYDKLSVGYIYGCRYDYKGEGMYLRDALKTLKDRGICTYEELPYNEEVPEMINIFKKKSDYETDEYNKITSYFSVSPKDFLKIKHSLVNCGPMMISVPWYDDFEVVDGVVTSPSNFNCGFGYHALLLYGWDKQGWRIQNSWGTDWGDNGRVTYPYNYPIAEAYGVTDTTKVNPNIQVKKQNKVTNTCSKITNFMLNTFKRMTKI